MASPAKSKSGGKGSVALLKESVEWGCASHDSCPRKSFLWKEGILGSNHTVKFSKVTWNYIKIGKIRFHRRESIKSVHLVSAIRALPDLRKEHKTKLCINKMNPTEGHGIWRNKGKATFCSLVEARATPAPTSKYPKEREFVGDCEHQCTCSAKGFELRRNGDSAEIQDLYKGGDGQRRSANKRGNTSVRSRSWPLRDSATTGRSACYSIAWKTLRRPRIFLRVGQLSQTTVDQRGEDKFMQNEQFRTASFSRLSATSGSFSSSTSTFQELSSTTPAQERSDGLSPTNWWASHLKQTQTTVNGVSEKILWRFIL